MILQAITVIQRPAPHSWHGGTDHEEVERTFSEPAVMAMALLTRPSVLAALMSSTLRNGIFSWEEQQPFFIQMKYITKQLE